MAMKEHKALWVDPPSGWMYGFPKIFRPNTDGNLTDWLVKNGYPKENISKEMHFRFWDANEDE